MAIGLRIKSIFQKSLLKFKNTPRESISVALYLIWGLWASLAIPHFGGILASLVFVSAYHFILTSSNVDRGLIGFAKFLARFDSWKSAPLVIFIFPSIILIGTAQALAFTPTNTPSLVFLGSFFLGWLTLIYLSIVLQAVHFYLNEKLHILVAADKALRVGFKDFKNLFIFNFYAAVMFVIGILPMGLGLIAALPIYFWCLQEYQKSK